jgi:hypothetical protein
MEVLTMRRCGRTPGTARGTARGTGHGPGAGPHRRPGNAGEKDTELTFSATIRSP